MIKKDTFDKEKFKKELEANVRMLFRRKLEEATPQQIYQAVAYSVKDDIIDNWIETHKAYEKQDKKMVYYMSMEFLMGRALGNNMINLLCYDDVREIISKVQTMRKEAGFEVTDHITVYEDGNDKIKEIMTKYADEIKNDVLADDMRVDAEGGYSKEWDINGEKVRLGVEKKM